jgi:cytoskeletal protein RodZ
VTVGESLTRARRQAGLTVDELSDRTKIRSTVIRSIEADDYAACGGDLYVRGYVRAIAGAVGVDAQGLIREYDQKQAHATDDADATKFDLPAVPANPAAPVVPAAAAAAEPAAADAEPAAEAEPAADVEHAADAAPAAGPPSAFHRDLDETRFDLPPVREDSAATRFDIPAVRADSAEDLMAAGYGVHPPVGDAGGGRATPSDDPWQRTPAGAAGAGPAAQKPRGHRRLLAGVAAVAVLVLAGVLGVSLASGSTSSKNTANTAAGSGKASTSASPATSAAADSTPAAKASATPSASPSASPTHSATVPPPVTRLSLASAEAFGPGGLGDGDNASAAGYAIDSNASLPWSTNWYTTPHFGMLKDGTGLLIRLAHQSTITSVRLNLTGYRGVSLQLKAANGTSPGDFKVVATADNTGGTVRLTLSHPTSARYLLIWFTQLPPNGAGNYQESVYHVLVNGRR